MDINLRQIRAFVSVAHAKSFTRAATLLHLSQPALTVQIRRLEEALGVRLLDRTTRGADLTRMGRELAPGFQRILRDLDTLTIDARDHAARRHGVVRLAALPSLAAGILPEVVASARSMSPRITFVIRDVIAHRVLELVRSEEVDLGLTGGPVLGPDLEVLHSSEDRLHVVYPAGHQIGSLDEVSLDDLAAHPLILMHPDTSVRAVVDAAFVAGDRLPLPACEATYIMTAVGMVRAGLGIAILPASAREISSEPTLRSRSIAGPDFVRRISVVRKAGRTLPPIASLFLDVLVSELNSAADRLPADKAQDAT